MKTILHFSLVIICLLIITSCQNQSEVENQVKRPLLNNHDGHDQHDDHEGHESEKDDHHNHEGHESEKDDHHNHEGHESEKDDHDDHDSHVEEELFLSSEAITNIGLQIKQVQKKHLAYEIHLNGEVGPNEEKLQHIAPRFAGLVKEVYKKQGAKVITGEKLALIQNNETLSNYYVQSYYSGTIIEKHITVGEVVDNSQTLFVVADLKTLWINFDVYAKDEDKVKRGQWIEIEMVGSNKKAKGKINYISQVYDQSKRSLTARVELANQTLKWKPGAFVNGHISVNSGDEKTLIERQALQLVEDQTIVFIPKKKNVFSWVTVKTGSNNQSFVEILDGLEIGDDYVTQGAFELKSELVTRNLGSHAGHGH